MLCWFGASPVADDAGADHVGKKFVFFAVPHKDDRAGAAAAIVDFGKLARSSEHADLHFVLQHAQVGQSMSRIDFRFALGKPRPATMSGGARWPK